MSVCLSNQACLSVHQTRHVRQSTKSGMSVSPSDQACPLVHQNVRGVGAGEKGGGSKMQVSLATLKRTSVPRL